MKNLKTLSTALLFVVIFFISGCTEKCTDGICCDDGSAGPWGYPATHLDPVQYPYQQFTGTLQTNVFYYYYLPGTPTRVQFFKGETKDGICTNEHLTINPKVVATAVASDRPIKIFGEVYWSVFSDETVLYNSVLNANQEIKGSISDVGLKQAFPEGAATIDVYITVEFESLGTLTADITYFQQHILYMSSLYDYTKF